MAPRRKCCQPLNLAGTTYAGTAGQTFTILKNDGGNAISGTFNGLPEGAYLVWTGNSTLAARISYVGGTGHDVVRDLTLANGGGSGFAGQGGAIDNAGTLTVNSCVFNANSINTNSGNGGAIYNENSGSLTFAPCALRCELDLDRSP